MSKQKEKQVSIRLSSEWLSKIENVCKEHNIKKTQLIRDSIKFYMQDKYGVKLTEDME